MKPDWWCGKDYALLKATDVFGTVRGRKALHKILYFANLKTGTFKYQWYTYGPFSPDLAYKIEDHVHDESLDIEEGGSGGRTRYDMRLSDEGRELLEYGPHPEIDSALAWVRGLLGDMPPRDMELMASVHYLFACGHERGAIYGMMQRLKPESGFAQADVERALKFLEARGLLEPELAVPGFPRTPAVRKLLADLEQRPARA